MAIIKAWAPYAKTVEVETGNSIFALNCGERGWWDADIPRIEHGSDYAFRIDGEGPFPDPRSASQPLGVLGPSRWVDHAKFSWTDHAWQSPPLDSAIFYELHVGTFTPEGTFDAAAGRLNYLKKMGVTHVEIMPVAEFSGARGWGYDGVDLYAPHHAYGGAEGLKRLVNACHAEGLAVVLDVVYNHLGPAGNFLGKFGPYFTDRYKTPWGEAVNLDGADSDEVRRFFIDNALMWLRDYHFDGLRLDAVHAIVDTSAIHFLEQLAVEAGRLGTELGRHFAIIAESDLNDPRIVRQREKGGYGLAAHWSDDFHHAVHALLAGERDGYYADFGKIADLAKVLTDAYVYDGKYSEYRKRTHGRPAADLPGRHFVVCTQNHDQVGNRAQGDRLSHSLSTGQLKIAAALLLLSPFIPLIFQGEEWGASTPFLYFTDHQDLELGAAVSKGRREEFAAFGWDPKNIPDPQSEETFLRSKLKWDEIEGTHREICEWYSQLIRLRGKRIATHEAEKPTIVCDETGQWLLTQCGETIAACNFSSGETKIPLSKIGIGLPGAPLLASHEEIRISSNAIDMPGHSVAIFAKSDCATGEQA